MSVEATYAFVDTNVLVYAHDLTAGHKHERAAQLMADLWRNRTGCLSTQVLTEFYVIATRKVERPLDEQTATQVIEGLSHWRVQSPRPGDVIEAIRIHRQYNSSYMGCSYCTERSVPGL
jgi:predicted nucleic acid-binding protein